MAAPRATSGAHGQDIAGESGSRARRSRSGTAAGYGATVLVRSWWSAGPVRLALWAVSALVLAACGAGSDDAHGNDGSTGPTVVDARFDGDFTVTELSLAGPDVELVTAPVITIDSVFGGLTVKPGCNTYFGSLTLTDEGQASFTVTGGSDQDCGELATQEEAMLDGLARVTGWREAPGGLRFSDGAGTELVVRR